VILLCARKKTASDRTGAVVFEEGVQATRRRLAMKPIMPSPASIKA